MNTKQENITKRVPKGEIKYKRPLSEEQKLHKTNMWNKTISLITGAAGSSKSFLACNIALDKFNKREVNRISFCRPTVATEDIGHLPGTLEEKYFQWCLPLIDNMYKMMGKEKIDKMIKEGDIIFRPLQFVAGVTFDNEVAIMDECQNATYDQTMRFLTRIGNNCNVILTGDSAQIDLKKKTDSGFSKLVKAIELIDDAYHAHMQGNYRNPVVKEVLKYYK
jgi:phosphate starvation-inducible PhoH-like protein